MTRRTRKSLVYWAILSPFVVVILFPYAVMLSTAIKARDEVFTYPPRWLPSHAVWSNFVDMWEAASFGPALLNSLGVAVGSTLLALALGAPAAYAISHFRFRGRGPFSQLLLVTQMLSPIVLIVGVFRLMAALNGIDSLWALTATYAAFNLAFTVWMLQSYFDTIPKELEQAAWIDGANRVQSFVHVFLPLTVPAIAIAALFAFIFAWNEFVLALTLLRSPDKFTLTLSVYSLVGGRYTVEWHQVMAAALAATVPVAVLFVVFQRALVRGLSLGSQK